MLLSSCTTSHELTRFAKKHRSQVLTLLKMLLLGLALAVCRGKHAVTTNILHRFIRQIKHTSHTVLFLRGNLGNAILGNRVL